ncbi:MAG: Tyrosine recombinase XerD [Candidatus Erwinia impunctatus]|nr:Tyrosine recombinase XerD [Culicoides impunctatus]
MKKRRYLTAEEVKRLLVAAREEKNGIRDYCLVLLAFRHGMRISEVLSLRYSDIDMGQGRINIHRLKNGFSTVHPLISDEQCAINEWSKIRNTWLNPAALSDYLFITRKGVPLSRQQAYRIIHNAGKRALLPTNAHPHMLRHACGYELAERGMDTRLIQDYLGHRNIRHTVRYTASNAARFIGIWDRPSR